MAELGITQTCIIDKRGERVGFNPSTVEISRSFGIAKQGNGSLLTEFCV